MDAPLAVVRFSPSATAQFVGAYAALALAWQLGLASALPALSLDRLAAELVRYIPSVEFWSSLVSTFTRIATAYMLAVIFAVPIGLLFGLLPTLEDLLDPVLAVIRPISPLGWLPFAVVWFGVSEAAAVFLIAYAAFFPIFLNTLQGVRGVESAYREAALTLGAGRATIIRRVLLPAALPSILTGLRLGMGLAWSVIVAAELVIGFVLQLGLGYLMLSYTLMTFNLTRLVILTAAVGLIGVALDRTLRYLIDRATPWRLGRHLGE